MVKGENIISKPSTSGLQREEGNHSPVGVRGAVPSLRGKSDVDNIGVCVRAEGEASLYLHLLIPYDVKTTWYVIELVDTCIYLQCLYINTRYSIELQSGVVV